MIWNTIGAVIGRICNIIFHSIVTGSVKMLFYYVMLVVGALFVIIAVFLIIAMYVDKDYLLLGIGKILGAFLIGSLLLMVTLPSLKYVVLKEYDVVSGNCVIEI